MEYQTISSCHINWLFIFLLFVYPIIGLKLISGGDFGLKYVETGAILITHRRLLHANLISHSVVPGIVLALFIRIDPIFGGILSGLIGAIVAEKLATIL